LPKSAKETAEQIINDLRAAATLSDVPEVRKLEGTDETVKVLSLTHRKDTYKKHNLPWRK